MTETKIALLRPENGYSNLRPMIESMDLGTVVGESEDYPTSPADLSLSIWRQLSPDIILIVSEKTDVLVNTVETLHEVLPKAWLLVASSTTDTEAVLKVVRAGAREFLDSPPSEEDIRAALGRYHGEKRQEEETQQPGKIYCVIGAKGGVGTTTVTVNLASALAQLPTTDVAVLDLVYPVGDAATFLDIRSKFTVFDALNASSRLDSFLLKSYAVEKFGVCLLASPSIVEAVEVPQIDSFKEVFRVVADTFTHSVLDVPSHFDPKYLGDFIELCDEVLLVVTPEVVAISRARRLLQYLSHCEITVEVRLLVNRIQLHGEITEKEIEQTLGLKVYSRLPNDHDTATQAINNATPLVKANRSALSEAYQQLAEELSGLTGAREKGTILNKLMPKFGRRLFRKDTREEAAKARTLKATALGE